MRDQGVARARAGALARALGRAPRRPPPGQRAGLAGGPPALAGAAGALARAARRGVRAGTGRGAGAGSRAGAGRAVAERAAANPYEALLATGPGRPGAAGGSGARDGRAPASRGHRDPALRARQRRPRHDLQAPGPARAARPHLLDLGARPAWPAGRRGSERAPPDRGGVPAAARSGAPGLRRLERRRRGDGHRLGHRLPVGAASRLPGPGVPDPGPRARLPPHLRRVQLVRRHLRPRPLRDLRRALAARPAGEPLRPATAPWFRLGVDHSIYRPHPVERRRDTVVFYAREVTARRAVPLGAAGAGGAEAPPAGRARGALRPTGPVPALLRARAPGHRRPGRARPPLLGGHGRALPVAHQLLADPAGDAGLRTALRGPGRRIHSEAEVGADSGAIVLRGARPVALASALEGLLDDEQAWERALARGPRVRALRIWELAASEVEHGLREALRERGGAEPFQPA